MAHPPSETLKSVTIAASPGRQITYRFADGSESTTYVHGPDSSWRREVRYAGERILGQAGPEACEFVTAIELVDVDQLLDGRIITYLGRSPGATTRQVLANAQLGELPIDHLRHRLDQLQTAGRIRRVPSSDLRERTAWALQDQARAGKGGR